VGNRVGKGASAVVYEAVGEGGVTVALKVAREDDAVLVTGSFYVVGEARSHLRDQ